MTGLHTHWGFVDRDLIFYIQSILLLNVRSDWRSFRTIVLMMKQLARHWKEWEGRRKTRKEGSINTLIQIDCSARRNYDPTRVVQLPSCTKGGTYLHIFHNIGRLWRKSQSRRNILRQLNLSRKELSRKTLYSWSVRLIDKLRRRGDGMDWSLSLEHVLKVSDLLWSWMWYICINEWLSNRKGMKMLWAIHR